MQRPMLRLPVAVLVATRNRPIHLNALLARLSALKDEFSKVIVVDASDTTIREQVRAVIRANTDLLDDVVFIESDDPSSARQRNLGLLECRRFDAVQILDDDVLPTSGFIRSSFDLLNQKGADGVSGITQEAQVPLTKLRMFDIFFGLVAKKQGGVSPTGIGTPVSPDGERPVEADWLIGCSMWRSSILRTEYEHSLSGTALFEDVIFSVSNKQSGGLWVDPSNVLHHGATLDSRPNHRTYWQRFGFNRIFVLREISRAPRIQLSRGNLGLALQIAFGSQSNKIESLGGLFKGWLAALRMPRVLT